MEEFRRFLERKASKASVRRFGRYIAWEEEDVIPKGPTEFLDMYYLSAKPGDVVVMDSSVARDLEERLKFLEAEVQKLKTRNDILKAAVIGLCIAVITLVMKLAGV